MAICTQCGSIGSEKDLEKHNCEKPLDKTVIKRNGNIEIINDAI